MKLSSIVKPFTCASLIDEFFTCFDCTFKDEMFSLTSGASKCLDVLKFKQICFDIFSKFVQELAREYKISEVLYPNGVNSIFYYNIDLSPLCEFFDAKAFRRLGFLEAMHVLNEYPAVTHFFTSILRRCGLNCCYVSANLPYITVSKFIFKYKY